MPFSLSSIDDTAPLDDLVDAVLRPKKRKDEDRQYLRDFLVELQHRHAFNIHAVTRVLLEAGGQQAVEALRAEAREIGRQALGGDKRADAQFRRIDTLLERLSAEIASVYDIYKLSDAERDELTSPSLELERPENVRRVPNETFPINVALALRPRRTGAGRPGRPWRDDALPVLVKQHGIPLDDAKTLRMAAAARRTGERDRAPRCDARTHPEGEDGDAG